MATDTDGVRDQPALTAESLPRQWARLEQGHLDPETVEMAVWTINRAEWEDIMPEALMWWCGAGRH